MIDFGSGSTKEIRNAIANSSSLNEDRTIAIFKPGSDEFEKLSVAAELLTLFSNNDYLVDETYFDYGQGWKWTTILKKDPEWGRVQVLTPRDQENILMARSPKELGEVCNKILKM